MSNANDELKRGWMVVPLPEQETALERAGELVMRHYEDEIARMVADLAATRARLAEAERLLHDTTLEWAAVGERLAEAVGLLERAERLLSSVSDTRKEIVAFLARERAKVMP